MTLFGNLGIVLVATIVAATPTAAQTARHELGHTIGSDHTFRTAKPRSGSPLTELPERPSVQRASPRSGAPSAHIYGYDGAANSYTVGLPSRQKSATRNR